jgi:hypothetical protein
LAFSSALLGLGLLPLSFWSGGWPWSPMPAGGVVCGEGADEGVSVAGGLSSADHAPRPKAKAVTPMAPPMSNARNLPLSVFMFHLC